MIPFIIVKTVKGFAYVRPERVVAINSSDADDCMILMTDGLIAAAEPAEDVVARLRNGGRRGTTRPRGDEGAQRPWPLQQTEIETMIREAFPDARIEGEDLAGDGNHYAATVVTPAFKGINKVKQHQMVYAALRGKWAATCARWR